MLSWLFTFADGKSCSTAVVERHARHVLGLGFAPDDDDDGEGGGGGGN